MVQAQGDDTSVGQRQGRWGLSGRAFVLPVLWSKSRGIDIRTYFFLLLLLFTFSSLPELTANSPEDLSLYVIKRRIGGERKKEREIETGTERKTDMQDRRKLEEEMFGGGGEKINVSSLLQIRRRLKSQHNPQGNPVWFEGLLVQPMPGWHRLWLQTISGN